MILMMCRTLIFVIVLNFVVLFGHAQPRESPSIGIVGAGIGGASTAYFMRQLFPDAEIVVYEQAKIGGRLATVNVGSHQYEAGGSIIHPANKYMVNFAKLLNLKHKSDGSASKIGLYDGKKIVFETSEWKIIAFIKLLWRYGWDIIRVLSYVKNLLSKFENIYALQDSGKAYSTPEKMLEAMGSDVPDLLHQSLRTHMKTRGFRALFIEEFATGAMRVNYGQTPDTQAFVGSVCLAGIEGNLWSVEGGNKLVPEGLLELSNATVVKATLTHIMFLEDEDTAEVKYVVEASGGVKEETIENSHDFVVIAAPIYNGQKDTIKFENFPRPIYSVSGKFHRTVATIVKGEINYKKFSFKSAEDFPSVLLTTSTEPFFNSIGKQTPINSKKSEGGDNHTDSKSRVWKVFSQKRLTEDQLHELFDSREITKVIDWQAYPSYKSVEDKLAPFVMFNQLYYVNAVEWAASAMEMSAIAARNVALLANSEWNRLSHRNVDQLPKKPSKNVEL